MNKTVNIVELINSIINLNKRNVVEFICDFVKYIINSVKLANNIKNSMNIHV